MKKYWYDTHNELYDTARKKELDQIFQHKIKKYLPAKEVKVPIHRYSLRMFANYIGCWWFDIVFGHDDTRPMKERGKTTFKMHKQAGYIQITNPSQSMYGVFVNANSKMAYINQIFSRSETECQRCVADFQLWCDHHHFPVVKIISDYEGGMANIAGIERHVAKENHKRFGIIDGFVNAVRQWNWANGYGAQLTPLHFRQFVNNVWNKDLVRGTKYTREQMIANSDYEEEYIAKCIYYNADQLEKRQEIIKVGQQARLAYENRPEPFERRPGKLMPGIFEIVSTSVPDQPGKMLVRNMKGKNGKKGPLQEVSKTTLRKIVKQSDSDEESVKPNDPVITEITPDMLSNLPEQTTDNLILKPIPQYTPSNSVQLAQQYEQSIDQIKEQLVQEVVSEINKRKDAEITRGFMPISRPEQLNKAVETTTENAELLKRKPIYGIRNRQYIDRSKIRRAAKEILDEVMIKFKLPDELTDGQFHKAGKVFNRKITHNEQPSKAVNPLVGN
jgi:hypothetical protein